MSLSSKPRVQRKHKSKKLYKPHECRKLLPWLLEDFLERCGYSLMHVKQTSERQMEVDHHDARLKKLSPYDNLFPAYSLCNRAKSDRPDDIDRRLGIRILNPCKETDYNEQIFEDPTTHELVATTPEADYHIEILDLNNPGLVEQRRERAVLTKMLGLSVQFSPVHSVSDPEAAAVLTAFAALLRYKIPPIDPPPKSKRA